MLSIRHFTAATPAALVFFLPVSFALPQPTQGALDSAKKVPAERLTKEDVAAKMKAVQEAAGDLELAQETEAAGASIQETVDDLTRDLEAEAQEAIEGLESLGEDLPEEGMGSESTLDEELESSEPLQTFRSEAGDPAEGLQLKGALINYTDGATLFGNRNSLDGNVGGGPLDAGAFRRQNIGDGLHGNATDEPDTFMDAVKDGRSWADFRYRLGAAEARGFRERSWPSTLRTAVGHETKSFRGFRALAEIEAIVRLFNPSYNDTVGSSPERTPVLDPEELEINQLFVAYDGFEGLDARLGRQEIELGNQRFVGSDPWRQNNQSFDALRLGYQVNEKLALDYTFGLQVNRILGDGSPVGHEDMNTHLLDARYTEEGIGNFAGYAYLIDFDDSTPVSTNTLGVRYDRIFEGERKGRGSETTSFWREMDYGVALEYAKQTDAGDNPFNVDADYLLIEASADYRGYRMSLASETLGGSGQAGDSFSTPLGSLHWFNGFADAFLATPDSGLNDRRFAIEKDIHLEALNFPIRAGLSYHLFDSDTGSIDYGRELDLDLRAALTEQLTVGAQYADFNGDEGYRHINRLSAWVAYRLTF